MSTSTLTPTLRAALRLTAMIRQGLAEEDARDDFMDLMAEPTPSAVALYAARRVEHAAIMGQRLVW